MRDLDAADWVVGAGTGPAWRAVTELRSEEAARELSRAADWARGVAALGPYATPRSAAAVLAAPAAARKALLLFPAMDFWLSCVPACLSGARPADEVLRHFAYLQSFAAAAAVLGGRPARLTVRLTPEARFHATGTRLSLSFPKSCAGAEAVVTASRGRLAGRCKTAVGRPALLPALAEGMWVEQDDPLVLSPVVMHGLVRNDARAQARFVAVLTAAMARLQEVDPGLFAEMTDFLRLIVPLANPKNYGSVSSSYRNMRGALCLSHSEDTLLQEETLIHEFCHQKANLLSAADPLLRPGQGGQVVYSPLRPDARRLWGLLLGAHAFVNVNRYLLKVLRREAFPAPRRASVQKNIARRLFHVDDMLRSVTLYGRLTGPGLRFLERLWKEHGLTLHDALDIPPALMEEGRSAWREHRAQKALGETGVFSAGAA